MLSFSLLLSYLHQPWMDILTVIYLISKQTAKFLLYKMMRLKKTTALQGVRKRNDYSSHWHPWDKKILWLWLLSCQTTLCASMSNMITNAPIYGIVNILCISYVRWKWYLCQEVYFLKLLCTSIKRRSDELFLKISQR